MKGELTYSAEHDYIPNITSVPLPKVLDLRESQSVVQLISALVEENAQLCPDYHGALLFGSIAHGDSTNDSDIDLVHVVADYNLEDRTSRMLAVLMLIFDYGYGIKANSIETWSIGDRRPWSHVLLDQDTRVLIPQVELRDHILRALGLETRQRRFKKGKSTPERPDSPHILNTQAIDSVDIRWLMAALIPS